MFEHLLAELPAGHRMAGAASADLTIGASAGTVLELVPMGEPIELDVAFMCVPGFERLADVLQSVYAQAVNDNAEVAFHQQTMQAKIRFHGTGLATCQAALQSAGAIHMDCDAAVNALLGAMITLARAVIELEDRSDKAV